MRMGMFKLIRLESLWFEPVTLEAVMTSSRLMLETACSVLLV